MREPFRGVINVDIRDSTPDWAPFEPPRAPDGAPNVVYIVLDDVGFSAMSCYGGPIETPNIDRLAAEGVRYTQWHTTALCSPTRCCLLTGRNHTLPLASPVALAARIRDGLARLREAFPRVTPYLASIPRYGGLWMMACGSATLDPAGVSAAEADRRIAHRGISHLRYYNGDMHRAALALPNFVRDLTRP